MYVCCKPKKLLELEYLNDFTLNTEIEKNNWIEVLFRTGSTEDNSGSVIAINFCEGININFWWTYYSQGLKDPMLVDHYLVQVLSDDYFNFNIMVMILCKVVSWRLELWRGICLCHDDQVTYSTHHSAHKLSHSSTEGFFLFTVCTSTTAACPNQSHALSLHKPAYLCVHVQTHTMYALVFLNE